MYPVTAGGMNSWMWALKSRTSQKKVLEKCLLYSTKVQISNGGKAVNSLLTATFHSKLQAGGLCWDLGVTISTWSLLGLFLARTTIQKWMLIKARCSTLKNASTLRLSFYTCTFKGAKKKPPKKQHNLCLHIPLSSSILFFLHCCSGSRECNTKTKWICTPQSMRSVSHNAKSTPQSSPKTQRFLP